MKLYLIQHGEAASEEANPSRPLTKKGAHDVEKIASFLKQAGMGSVFIRHSGKLRAKQTAEIIAASFGSAPRVQEAGNLSPNDPVQNLVEEAQKMTADLMIV